VPRHPDAGAVSIALYRVDDRLIHGQVVVGWGKRLNARFLVLVDDAVRASAWEQELYRMGVPPDMEVIFASTEEAARRLEEWERDPRVGMLVAGDVETIVRLCADSRRVPRVNIGGLHERPGRRARLRYVYLSEAEAAALKALAARGVEVTAQDVPTARPVPLGEFA
jgi:PTS system mannose-specific IIB component/fructoselysine and glucoselysine-specific PTS system IIB component